MQQQRKDDFAQHCNTDLMRGRKVPQRPLRDELERVLQIISRCGSSMMQARFGRCNQNKRTQSEVQYETQRLLIRTNWLFKM